MERVCTAWVSVPKLMPPFHTSAQPFPPDERKTDILMIKIREGKERKEQQMSPRMGPSSRSPDTSSLHPDSFNKCQQVPLCPEYTEGLLIIDHNNSGKNEPKIYGIHRALNRDLLETCG